MHILISNYINKILISFDTTKKQLIVVKFQVFTFYTELYRACTDVALMILDIS